MEKLGLAGDFAPIRRIWLGISRVGLTRSVAAAMMRSSEASSASGSDSVGRAQARPIGPEPEERSAEDTAARPAPRSRRVDRAHGARLLAQGSEPHRIGARGRRRAPSRREAGGRPPPRAGGEPSENLFSDGSAGSSRNCPDPDGESEQPGSKRGADGRRREIRVHGSQTSCDNRGPGAGPGSAPVPDGRIVLRELRPVAGLRSPEKLTGSRSGRLLGASSRPPVGICTLNRFAVAERLRG